MEGMQRYEKLEIPKEALREILYNAIAHKDYTGPDIQMHVYNDHLEIWNEGELPVGYTQETLFRRHSSKPRNLNIANTFFKAGFIDTWGRGYQKIRDGFEPAGIPMPKVENFCGGVQVTIERTAFMKMVNGHNLVPDNVPDNVPDTIRSVSGLSKVQLSERQKKICDIVKKDSRASATEMSILLSVVPKTVKRDLAAMQKMGVIIREGNAKAGHWVLLINRTE